MTRRRTQQIVQPIEMNHVVLANRTESAVAMNSREANSPGVQQFQTPTYTLYVEP